tara:strand:+ start:570 stop:773 length:204 start_codon:yes stop_codon:yes gene_type:complete
MPAKVVDVSKTVTFVDYKMYANKETKEFQLDRELNLGQLFNGDVKEGDTLRVTVEDGRITFRKWYVS